MNNSSVTPQYNPKGHSFSGWLGGKSRLSRTIVEMMPEHKTYVEVFGGAGWVLFKKTPSRAEVINDVNDNLVNLYRILKFHFDAFLAEFEHHLFRLKLSVIDNISFLVLTIYDLSMILIFF